VGVGFRVLCRAGNLTMAVQQNGHREQCGAGTAVRVKASIVHACFAGIKCLFRGSLNLRAFLYEAHARQDLGGLFQSRQIVSREVSAGKRSVRTLPRHLHHTHNLTL
jgi:hypothetical protein